MPGFKIRLKPLESAPLWLSVWRMIAFKKNADISCALGISIWGYEEVSYAELQRYVSAEKMKVLDELFAHIAARDYAGIDLWIERCERELPIVEDRWMQENRVIDVDVLFRRGQLTSAWSGLAAFIPSLFSVATLAHGMGWVIGLILSLVIVESLGLLWPTRWYDEAVQGKM